MASYIALSRNQHAGRRWRRPTTFAHAASVALVPLAAEELLRAAASLPIAITSPGAAIWAPMALLGVDEQRSLFVAPDGRWLGEYVPATLRAYPFALASSPGSDRRVLCIDADGTALSDDPSDEPLLEADGTPSPALQPVLAFLEALLRGQARARQQCAALHAQGLVVPWPLRLSLPGGAERAIEGLWRVDPDGLGALSEAALLKLRPSGAMALAYAQVVSQAHVGTLGRLAALHATISPASVGGQAGPLPISGDGDLDLEFLAHGGTLDLGGLR